MTGSRNICKSALAAAVLAVACNAGHSSPTPPVAPSGLPLTEVTLAPDAAPAVTVTAEVARTRLSRQKGLMGRTELAPLDGMLFIFEYDRRNSFWMKNTPLPLDMIFISGDKVVVGCVERTTPNSTQRYGVDALSRYVLEVNAGFCARHHITPGTRVEF